MKDVWDTALHVLQEPKYLIHLLLTFMTLCKHFKDGTINLQSSFAHCTNSQINFVSYLYLVWCN